MPKPAEKTETRNVTIPTKLDNYVQSLLDDGSFTNYSEFIRTAIRAYKQHEEDRELRLNALREQANSALEAYRNGTNPPITKEQLRANGRRD